MSVMIRPMTSKEFERFYKWSAEHQVKELMKELHMSQADAIKEALHELARMLPDGLNTACNHLMSIVVEESEEVVGFIWTIHEETAGRKQSFLCDLAIWEPKRRKRYATVALSLAEKNAAEAGCRESVLFVADRNDAAKALYGKQGYVFLRQEGYGSYMIKQLSSV